MLNFEKRVRRTRIVILLVSGAILLIQTAMMYAVSMPSMTSLATARWIVDHVADNSQVVYEFQAGEAQTLTYRWPNAGSFIWRLVPTVDTASFSQWIAQGFHYVLIDERTFPGQAFDQRIRDLEDQHATLIYESQNPLNIGPRQAVLWTFRPDFPLNLTFDNSLLLIGYNVMRDAHGPTALLLHWYTIAPPSTAYHIFVHLLDGSTLLGQSDTVLGDGPHTTDTWRKNEIVFMSVALPVLKNAAPPLHIRIGLYHFDTGLRASINGTSGKNYIDLTVNDSALNAFENGSIGVSER